MTKPPYQVPTVHEIASRVTEDAPTVASLFAGGGGSSTGYRMAGLRVVYANEFIEAAAETYARNWPGTPIDTRDVRAVTGAEIKRIAKVDNVDVLDGSPPCSAFSICGKRHKSWGQIKPYSDTEQRVDDLFFEFARILGELQPRMFVAENVAGLVKGTAKGYFVRILSALRACGYAVTAKLLNAQWLGVPQSRERIIFVGVRNDLGFAPVHPDPLPYCYTLREALSGVPLGGHIHKIAEGSKTELLYWSTPRGSALSEGHRLRFGTDTTWHSHIRLSWDRPAPTVVASACQLYHPDEFRALTIAELKRVCSFPDDYEFTGSFAKQWERMGRSVPPVMMYHIARAVRGALERH